MDNDECEILNSQVGNSIPENPLIGQLNIEFRI